MKVDLSFIPAETMPPLYTLYSIIMAVNRTIEQKQPQYLIAGRSDIPTQGTTYTTHIIISPQLSTTPQKEIREHVELAIICT
jgi:hypothetical protein